MSRFPENTIVVMGDVHREFGALNSWINKKRPSLILQCGDFGYWPHWSDKKRNGNSHPVPKLHGGDLLFCDGNHEDHDSLRTLRDPEVYPGVRYMRRGSSIQLLDGRNVLFMGGADSIDKHIRKLGFDWFPQEVLTQEDIYRLPVMSIDVVISHTCPREFAIPYLGDSEKDSDPSRMVLSYILHRYRPKLWYFGHWHFFGQGVYKSSGPDGWECHWTALDRINGLSRWWIELDDFGNDSVTAWDNQQLKEPVDDENNEP